MHQFQDFSNLAKVVYKRTYSRNINGKKEDWTDIVNRVVRGNTQNFNVSPQEKQDLTNILLNRDALPGGRGLWMSGVDAPKIGGTAQVNCFFWSADKFENFVHAMDCLMLGGGVGMSVESKYVSNLPSIYYGVKITRVSDYDADFIIPDNREGWCEFIYRVLKSFFKTGKSFTYSTKAIRPHGELIKTFGGTASGPDPLVKCVEKICNILNQFCEKKLTSVFAGDIITCIGEMVVAGNVRRSAIILIGDVWDKEYLQAKNWSLGTIPNNRAFANYSVMCDNYEDLGPYFWATYENGEPFGIVNITNAQRFGRIGDYKIDPGIGVNPCGEIILENGEPCNIADLQLHRTKSVEDACKNARLMFRYMKRVTQLPYHNPITQAVISKNQRVGLGLTGCLASPLFNPKDLNTIYQAVQEENYSYSKFLNTTPSIRTTTIKPAGTGSKVTDAEGLEGIHAGLSRWSIQRIRIASNDPLIPILKAAGHYMEPVQKFDGSLDHSTLVVDFYVHTPEPAPVADENWTLEKQLDVVKMVQQHWSDNSVSVTVYYKKDEIQKIKNWLKDNLQNIKTISFLCYNDHGFIQAPKEAITKEQYESGMSRLKPLDIDADMGDNTIDGIECAGGVCPVR